jgi:hypothetical protein
MPHTIKQKTTLYDRDLNLWLEEAITQKIIKLKLLDQSLETY